MENLAKRGQYFAALIKGAGLSHAEVAEKLWPGHTRPDMALRRIILGDGELKQSQLQALASLIGCDPGDLFRQGWSHKTEGKVHLFTKGDLSARLDLNTGVSRIFNKGSFIGDIALVKPMTSLREYLTALEDFAEQ